MARWRTITAFWALVVAHCLALTIGAMAQGTPAGTISGYILDPDGRALPRAHVVVKSPNTGATYAVTSNHKGLYSVPALHPQRYNITPEANGVHTLHHTVVAIEADQQARLGLA